MASVSNPGPEAVVTVKVTFEGTTRRAKMPLRDMVPRVLEENIRTFLHIPGESKAIIERYSDSAAAFVLLDSANQPVYKQLYRAAKAKSKLKLRVRIIDQEENTLPKPATVEDEAEASTAIDTITESTSQSIKEEAETVTEALTPPAAPAPAPAHNEIKLPLRGPPFAKTYSADLLRDAAKYVSERPEVQREFEARLGSLVERNSCLAKHMAAQLDKSRAVPDCQQRGGELICTETVSNASTLASSCPASFAVCCNSCEKTVSAAHYHCSTCDDGDFDLCQCCVDQGITCYSNDHWLIKRIMVDGQLVNSSTETIAPKPRKKTESNKEVIPPVTSSTIPKISLEPTGSRWTCFSNMRTCNCCVQELAEHDFLHCTTCDDYDLCQTCFGKDAHGHHPKHAFEPAVGGTKMPEHIRVRMAAGRNQVHHAICDGCDKYITGVRHKCLDCPDWDYCSECVPNAPFVHADHRFTPVYEPLIDIQSSPMAHPVHMGICCDGPLCSSAQGYPTYIRGVRYKCAVCHDLDFCGNCEASPANDHNKTHPLIKFKTPVRHVSVTTSGEHQDGKRMPTMGDRSRTNSKATETVSPLDGNTMNAVQTVVDVKPMDAPVSNAEPEVDIKEEEQAIPTLDEKSTIKEQDLRAVFLRDSVPDGTVLPPNHVFEQTWVLRNEGNATWPAGCSVKFVGGDYMGHVDSAHPAGISELVSASESTVCYAPLAPGQEFSFTVLLRTPARAGKIISYWRLTTPEGFKYGHRLWCEVNVRMPSFEALPKPVEEPKQETAKSDSVMIFPKLEKESPVASMHEDTQTESSTQDEKSSEIDALEDAEWDGSDDGFPTDEEFDILDASDEEYLEDQPKSFRWK